MPNDTRTGLKISGNRFYEVIKSPYKLTLFKLIRIKQTLFLHFILYFHFMFALNGNWCKILIYPILRTCLPEAIMLSGYPRHLGSGSLGSFSARTGGAVALVWSIKSRLDLYENPNISAFMCLHHSDCVILSHNALVRNTYVCTNVYVPRRDGKPECVTTVRRQRERKRHG